MSYSSKLPNDPKNPKKKRELAERAKRGESGTVKNGRGKDVVVDGGDVTPDNFASCDKCGSLGGYLDPADARRAETMHNATAHPDAVSVEVQKKRNKEGGRRQ